MPNPNTTEAAKRLEEVARMAKAHLAAYPDFGAGDSATIHSLALTGEQMTALAAILAAPQGNLQNLQSAPQGQGVPVAWRVKDFADGWIYYGEEAKARDEAQFMGSALIEPLYATQPPSAPYQLDEAMVERTSAVLRERQCGLAYPCEETARAVLQAALAGDA